MTPTPTSEFARALEALKQKLLSQNLTPEEFVTIIRALKIADRLMQEPSEEMEDAADQPFHDAWKRSREFSQQNYKTEAHASVSFSIPIFKAMTTQLLKEIEG